MATSLAQQLRQLAIPQSLQQTEVRKKASLLFDGKEAAHLDRKTFYDIGVDGLRELIELDPVFKKFKDNLFELSSVSLERTIAAKEVNQKIDKLIKKFFHLLSPYLLLKSAHKALEWLVCRYLIHEFNIEELMGLILPYHQTNIFVKILQLIDLKQPCCNHWNWLIDIQKQGFHLPKAVLINHAISNPAFLRFICDTLLQTMKEHSKHQSEKKLGTLLTFYCTAIVSILSRGPVDEKLLTIILPSFIKSLSSNLIDFKAAGYMIGGQLVTSNQLSKLIIDEIISTLFKDDSKVLEKERMVFLVLIFQHQKPQPLIPEEFLEKLSDFPKKLKDLANEEVLVGYLVARLIWTCLRHVIEAGQRTVDAQIIAWSLATEVDLDLLNCKNLIRIIDESHTVLDELLRLPNAKKKRDPSHLKWMKELMGATLDRHFDVLEKSKDDLAFQKIREKWKSDDDIDIQEKAIIKLMKKCKGNNVESTWLQLRPLLLDKIENDKVFKALCNIAPTYDYLVLLLCLERLLTSEKYSEQTQELTIKKIFKTQFGKTNPLLLDIKEKLEARTAEDKKKNTVYDIIESSMMAQNDTENAIGFEPWHSAVEELKKINKVAEHSLIWKLGLRVLNTTLSAQYNPAHALQMWKLLFFIKNRNGKTRVEILNSLFHVRNKNLLEEIIASTISHLEKSKKVKYEWFDFSNIDPTTCLKMTVTECLLYGLHSNHLFKKDCLTIMDRFSKNCFTDQSAFLIFLSAVCCGKFSPSDPELKLSPYLQLYSLHTAWMRLASKEKIVYELNKSEINKLVCYLLITLGNPSMAVRGAAIKVLEALIELFKIHGTDSITVFLEYLFTRFQEIDVDPKQLNVALYCCLSPASSVQATLPKNAIGPCGEAREMILETITSDNIPLSVSARILQVLEGINSSEIIVRLAKLARRALDSNSNLEVSNIILAQFWSRINEATADVLELEEIWDLAEKSIKHPKCDDLCPAVTFLKSITKEVFDVLPDKKKYELLKLMIVTRSETESSPAGSSITSVMKKINVESEIIIPLIKGMTAPFIGPQKPKEPNPIVLASIMIESREWKSGISLLELIQSKKKLQNSHLLLEPLFSVLKFCLDQEEQTSFEYSKQLVLGCLLSCCQKLTPDNLIVDESILNVELAVQCLRASSNPQTHHHALLLLACLAALIPDQVMHNIMAIFTFMGSSLARLDDEYSVKILTQVVEMVTPVLLKSFDKEDLSNQAVMAEILRVFVWALRDIPQHRRKPLFLQLLTTLGPEKALWKFLVLLFESYVMQGDTSKNETLSMPTSLYLGLELCLAMHPKIVMECTVNVVNYLTKLPMEKMNPEGSPSRKVQKLPTPEKRPNDGLFDVENHTPKQIRHFAYTNLTFFNTLFSDNNFMAQAADANNREQDTMEIVFKDCIAAFMKFIPIVNRQYEKFQNKFWKAMSHHCYDLLDKLVSLVSNSMLLNVINKLLNHAMGPLRRKALDLLNIRLQNHRDDFSDSERNHMRMLIDPLLTIVKSIGVETEQETELIQQTALFSIKLIARLLAHEDTRFFKEVLKELCKICKTKKCQGPLLGSVLLTIAELVACLKAHAVSELPIFMPVMLKIFAKKTEEKNSDLGLTSVVMALLKIVDVLHHFLSPYLNTLLSTISIASVNFKENTELIKKLTHIRQKLSNNVAYRVLLPAFSGCYDQLLKSENYEAIGPLMSLLADSFSASPEVLKFLPELTQFFITALQFRSDLSDDLDDDDDSSDISLEMIDSVEGFIIEALVPLVLKLSESSFKPLYFQLFHWSSEDSDRSITFYRLSHKLAEKLKGLFVLFAGHFLQNAAQLLDLTNLSKTKKLYYGNSEIGKQKSIILLENILKTLHSVFLYDSTGSTNFLNKDKFEVLLHPLVDQLDNTLGGIDSLENRIETLLTPCLAQMALATDDILWKSLNYQILVKTKSSVPQVRIGALDTIVAIATKLGEDYLILLPETIGSLAELLEDDDERVENAIKKAIQKLEDVLGEPVKEYFQ